MAALRTSDPAADPGKRAGDPDAGVAGPRSITVFFDPGCELCRRCRAWLEVQRTWLPIHFVAADAEQARRLLPQVPWLGTELVVIGDRGETWIGSAAFLTCLWATRRYRSWSLRLAGPSFALLAERFFRIVSSNRGTVAAVLRADDCDDGACRHQGARVPPRRRVPVAMPNAAPTTAPAPPSAAGWPPGWSPPPTWHPPAQP